MKLGHGQGTVRLVQLLGQIREFETSTLSERDIDNCAVCGDCECSGACEGAIYIVRQVMEALDDVDIAAWWLENFGLIDDTWRGSP